MMATVKRRPKRTARETTLGNVSAAAKRADERREAGGKRWLKLDDGEQVVVRVVDVGKDFKDAYVHRVPMTSQGDDGETKTYHADVPCLDQAEKGVPCPGCKKGLDRRYKFWANVIVRDHEDEEGNTEDTIMILSGGINLARKLGKMDAKHGLRNRDIEIEREGVKKKTRYEADWADEEDVPLSDADEALIEKRHDIDRYCKIPDFDDFFKTPRERNADDDDDDDTGAKSVRRNILKRERSDNGDGEDAEPAPRRTVKKAGTTARKTNPLSPSGGSKTKTVVRRRA
jgi:hypothetical protein